MAGKENHRKRKIHVGEDQPVAERCRSSYSTRLMQALTDGAIGEISNILESMSHYIPSKTLDSAIYKASELGQKRILQLLISQRLKLKKKDKLNSSSLITAAEHGFIDIVKILVRSGMDVNFKTKSGQTALMVATVKACSLPLIEYLTSQEACSNVNIQDNKGRTVLMLAIENQDYCAIKHFAYHKDTDFNLKDKNGISALDMAKERGIEDLLDVFIDSKKNVQSTPLIMAVKKGNIKLVKLILESEFPGIVNVADAKGYTPLMLALFDSNETDLNRSIFFDIVRVLLNYGASVNKATKKNISPIYLATLAGNLEAIKLLVQHKADLNNQTAEKMTPLMVASQKNRPDIAEYLIRCQANVNLMNAKNETALILALKCGNNQRGVELLLDHGAELDDTVFQLAAEKGQYKLFPNVRETVSIEMRNKLLVFAIKEIDLELAAFILDQGADVNQGGMAQPVPLVLAAKDHKMVELLLHHGAKIDEKDCKDNSALMEAVRLDNSKSIQVLIKHGACMNLETSFGDTALIYASKFEKMNALKALLEGGIDLNYVTHSGKSALHLSIIAGKQKAIKMLLQHGANVNLEDHKGMTPLMLAVFGEGNIIPLLLLNGADSNKQSCDGSTALMYALKQRDIAKIKMLISSGTDLSITNKNGETALIIAAQYCTTIILEMLIKAGANVHAQDNNGSSVLVCAVSHSIAHESKIALLIDYGVDVNKPNFRRETPLIIAALRCNVNIMHLLISKGADVNIQDINGSTALVHAVVSESYDKVKLLIDSHVDMDIQDNTGCTAVMHAAVCANNQAMKTLIESGANINITDDAGRSAIWWVLDTLHGWSLLNDNFGTFQCLKTLLQAGAIPDMSKIENALLFHKLIVSFDQIDLIELFVISGAAPPLVPFGMIRNICSVPYEYYATAQVGELISPLLTAIFCKNIYLASYFLQIWYLTQGDVVLQQNQGIRKRVAQEAMELGDSVIDFIFKPLSLASLSFVKVSAVLGNNHDRESRIRMLPVPLVVQNSLLYKHKSRCIQDYLSTGVTQYRANPYFRNTRILGLDALD
ncbi:putative ankyrin repeat protein RF_0381 [Physella acuta]|uniref:putative ankyrin repeat protein RF_0381 n=1 Tax=Physella acuta TaxID=109671 RepID=UPI0027DB73BC|nr:putative ankyrin repeat protein RF_0381 [Physella acuta]